MAMGLAFVAPTTVTEVAHRVGVVDAVEAEDIVTRLAVATRVADGAEAMAPAEIGLAGTVLVAVEKRLLVR